MSTAPANRIFTKLVVLGLLSFCLWAFSGKEAVSQQGGQPLPIIVKQLEGTNDVIPVELRCAAASLALPDRLESFSCNLKNNTNKNIIAGNVAYSVILESGGKEVTDTRFHTFDTFVHRDLYEANKSIPPGGEHVVEPPGPTFYAASVIKAIRIEIDYIEFEDKTTLGSNERGAQIIADIREGAARYRDWLAQKYAENGRSAEAIVHLLQQDLPIPDLGVKNQYQEQGERAYRTRLRHIRETRGTGEIDKYLRKQM